MTIAEKDEEEERAAEEAGQDADGEDGFDVGGGEFTGCGVGDGE